MHKKISITKKRLKLAKKLLKKVREVVGDTPIVIDYLMHPRPLGLAKYLLEHGFCVEAVYLDGVSPEEEQEFYWLSKHAPELSFARPFSQRCACFQEIMKEKCWHWDKKAAWFTQSPYFVNVVEGAGWYGFDGIRKMAELMIRAYKEEKRSGGSGCAKRMGVRKLHMRQTYKIIPIYTADVSGVCSALYELGGMTVMHDPSGCNSTYNTHDEIRWYDQDSLIYISGLTEIDAIMGNDEKFLNDIMDAARELKPRFIALAGSPIPYMNGTDFPALAEVLEQELGIPTFSVPTNGMHDYVYGAGLALEQIARQFVPAKAVCEEKIYSHIRLIFLVSRRLILEHIAVPDI